MSRLDYLIFTHILCSTELVRKEASLIACCVVESSADAKDIDSNTLRVIVSRAFRGGDIPLVTLTAILVQLVIEINEPVSNSRRPKRRKQAWRTGTSQPIIRSC